MTAPELIIVWLAATELAGPGTAALAGAAREVLGAQTEVRLETEPGAALPRNARDLRTAFVRVTWDASADGSARVICYMPSPGGRVEREVRFAAADPEPERGRALGFLIASIFTNEPEAPEAAASASPPVDTGAEDGLASRPPARAEPTTSIGAGAEAAGPGAGTGFGAWLGAERALSARSLWVGGSVRARFGSVPVAQATTRYLSLGATATWLPLKPSESSWLGLKGGFFVSRLTISHLSDDDVRPDEKSRWLPGAELALHAGVDFSPTAGLFSDAGVELLAGRTELSVRHAVVAAWPRAAGLLRLGVRTRF